MLTTYKRYKQNNPRTKTTTKIKIYETAKKKSTKD